MAIRFPSRAPHLPLPAPLAAVAAALVLGGCAAGPGGGPGPGAERTATIQRTANGVAHIEARDFETLAYGMAYAYAEDNVCMTAQHLVSVRGERSRHFGSAARTVLGFAQLTNEYADFFIAAHIDDAALARAAAAKSPRVQALYRGYIAGYNRYLADHAGRLPAACNGAPWVQPMTLADYLRINELFAVQAGVGALADAVVAAAPPVPGSAAAEPTAEPVRLADAVKAFEARGLVDLPLGSNAWAFGRESTSTGRGLLLGNPHFPWVGVNRFWQVHLTVPGEMDVMGVAIGTAPTVVIGFNRDIAWSHTVSTGRRFTLHELTLVPGDPTSYLVDGKPEKMTPRRLTIATRDAAGRTSEKSTTLWRSRYGPIVVIRNAGLTWTAQRAYAIQDANAGDMRFYDTALGFATARGVDDIRAALANLGTPWVNTIATDRGGNAFYADASVVPDVDGAQLQRCKPSEAAARLLPAAGIVVLDGSRGECDWRRDPASPVPGLTPLTRMPVAVRSDWVINSNDSFAYTHPQQRFGPISPMVGDGIVRQQRTRSSLIEVPELVARGPVTLEGVQRQLFGNRNLVARMVLPDLLAACPGAPTAEARDACAVLAAWDRLSDGPSRGAHLFREFWRSAMAIPNVWRVPFDRAQPVATPYGLRLADGAVAEKVWGALAEAAKKVRAAGFALDAPLSTVMRPAITGQPIGLHGGQTWEGVLNYLGDLAQPGIGAGGLRIDYGTSYVQTVTFDDRGPVAQALLTYGQSTDPASPHATDQLQLFSRKEWPRLPFHADEVARQRSGEVVRLTRP